MPNKVVWQFDRLCRSCSQKQRNEKKYENPALAIVTDRASTRAHRAGVPTEFFMVNMNYRALVPEYAAALGPEGRCKSCGWSFTGQHDIQIEHILPPRGPRDWARLHARNLRLLCGSCNKVKGPRDFGPWLDWSEAARVANDQEEVDRLAREQEERRKAAEALEAAKPVQLTLLG